ncbi:MAG: amidohydrolase [Calditrichaeota bacterium]|nr:MAG: amidohydrolase [Calditrichota bacterium]
MQAIKSSPSSLAIDAHQHFWQYSASEYGWIDERMSALKRDFLPADLRPLLQAARLQGSIAVQARQTIEETRRLLQLADAHDFILGVVGWVELCSDQVEQQLEEFAAHPKLSGLRHVVQDEADDFMLRSAFVRGIQALASLNKTYDILIFPRQLPAAIELVRRFPQQRFVLDHIAKPCIRDHLLSPWAEQIHRLAEYDNVWCKVSGMVTEADWKAWTPRDFRPFLDVVFEAFGVQRIMFGSDWPVCTVAASYQQVFELFDHYIQAFSADEKASLFGLNCVRAYDLDLKGAKKDLAR